MPAFVDRTNNRYGRLTVIERVPNRFYGGRNLVFWRCECDCGSMLEIQSSDLQTGNTKSCGCIGKGTHDRHGHARRHTGAYRSWQAMRKRCEYPNDSHYPAYGGRGIKVCERWNKFENFLVDMGERPEGYSISRLDHDKDYEPDNCEWAPHGTH